MARGGFARASRRVSSGRKLGPLVPLIGAGVLLVIVVGVLFFGASKAESNKPPRALITTSATNVPPAR
jgi:hypothetical protein